MPPIDWSQLDWPALLALLLGAVAMVVIGAISLLRATWYNHGYSRGYERGVEAGRKQAWW